MSDSSHKNESAAPLVLARKVTKSYGTLEAVHEVDLEVAMSEVVAIVGPSGSGKSTLLRCLNGLEAPDSGTIEIAGRRLDVHDKSVHLLRAEIGMVFQQFNLFPHLTVRDNVALAPQIVRGLTREQARSRAEEQLRRVGLAAKFDAYPAELSGGQQQRVAIARSLAMDPKVMLFDEPTSALDTEMIGEVLGVMRDLAESGMTMIVVSHELNFVREVADRVAFIDGGRILECGLPAQILAHASHPRAREFFEKVL